MKITDRQLKRAVQEGILSQAQAEDLVRFVRDDTGAGPGFDFTHVLYYMGGLLAIGAMTLFMNLGWEAFGGWGILVICIMYAAAGLGMIGFFRRRNLHVPAGICAVFVVALTPLAIYGLQRGMGWWPDSSVYRDYHRFIRYHWVFMELGTLAVGSVMAWRYRYPFLVMPIAATLWYLSMDLAPLIFGDRLDFREQAWVSVAFGLATLALALVVDLRTRGQRDYGFWLYLFGVMTFWGGLTSLDSDSELARFVYLLVNLGLIGCGVALVRRVFVVFGAVGCTIYFGHLAATVFRDSWLFPFVLTGIGLGVIWLGVLWQRHEAAITARVHALLPPHLARLVRGREQE